MNKIEQSEELGRKFCLDDGGVIPALDGDFLNLLAGETDSVGFIRAWLRGYHREVDAKFFGKNNLTNN